VLRHVFASNLATPSAAVGALAGDLTPTSPQSLRGMVAGHPNLPASTGVLGVPLTADALKYALAGHVTGEQRLANLAAASRAALVEHLTGTYDAPSGDLEYVRTHDVARGARAPMPYRVGCLLAFHPAATSAQSLAGLRRLLDSDRAQGAANRDRVVTAATRHPHELPDLADRALVQALRVELRAHAKVAERGDPYVARVADVVARARRVSPYSTDGWVVALRGTSHPDVVAAAVARGPMRAVILDAILNDAYLPPATLHLAWVAAYTSRPAQDRSACTARARRSAVRLAANAPAQVLETVVGGARAWADLTAITALADLSAHTLAVVWAAVQRLLAAERVLSALSPAQVVHQVARVAVHPNVSTDVAAQAHQVLVELCAKENLWARDRATAQALLMESTLRQDRPAGPVGISLPMEVVRQVAPHDLSYAAVSHLVRAALVESHEVLARPGVGAAVLRLERTFPGTLGDLLTTAASIAPAAG
jgi:hypothetical protein